MDKNEFAFDLFDPQQTQNMWDKMQRMRAECPVAQPSEGFYYTARYADTQRVFRDSRTFSCEGGFRAAGVVIPEDELFLAEMDAPLHPRLRKLLLKSFNPGMAKGAEDFTQSYISQLLSEIKGNGGGDIVAGLSARVPLAVTGHVLGIPLSDIAELSAQFFALLHTDWPAYGVKDKEHPDVGKDIAGSAPELAAYFDKMIDERRSGKVKTDDLVSQMVDADIEGAKLSTERIRSLAINFLSAGLSTTNLISNLYYRLITDADFDATLRRDPDLIPVAVDESLRFEPPVLFLFRSATQEAQIADTTVKPGDRLVTGIASANRDETVFERANEFRLNPDDPEHLAFGAGPHLCLGNHMARMEGRVAVEEFFRQFGPGQVQLAPDYHYHLMPHFLEYGPERLDVVVGADSGTR
jgi:cytochrome P450